MNDHSAAVSPETPSVGFDAASSAANRAATDSSIVCWAKRPTTAPIRANTTNQPHPVHNASGNEPPRITARATVVTKANKPKIPA